MLSPSVDTTPGTYWQVTPCSTWEEFKATSEMSPVCRNWKKSQTVSDPLEHHKKAKLKCWCAWPLLCQPHEEVSTRIVYSPMLSRHFHLRYFGHKHLLSRDCPQVSEHLLPRNAFTVVAFPHSLEPDISPPMSPCSWYRPLIVPPLCLSSSCPTLCHVCCPR